MGLAESKESHGFSVDKHNVFEIDGEAPDSWAFYAVLRFHAQYN